MRAVSKPEIAYLSYSSISLYLDCSEAWKRKYIDKVPSPPTPTLLLGSAIHDTIENAVRFRVEGSGERALTEMFAEAWQARVDGAPDCEWAADTPETVQDDGLRIVQGREFASMVRRLTPARDDAGLWIERKVELQVPGVPVPIIGYIDMVTVDGVINDFKTAARMWDANRAKEEIQPLVYLAALNQMGMTVPKNTFRHWVITKGKTPKVVEFENNHTWDSIFWMFEMVRRVWRGIEHEVFVPNPNTAWRCSPKWCPHWSTCRGKGL